jgi:hypothetical protein
MPSNPPPRKVPALIAIEKTQANNFPMVRDWYELSGSVAVYGAARIAQNRLEAMYER